MSSFLKDFRYGLGRGQDPGFTAVGADPGPWCRGECGHFQRAPRGRVARAGVPRCRPHRRDVDEEASARTCRTARPTSISGTGRKSSRDGDKSPPTSVLSSPAARSRAERGQNGSTSDSLDQDSSSCSAQPPLVGRTFEDGDYTATPRVVVIGHRLWQQHFGADRTVIGRRVQLNDQTVEIVGVMPLGFESRDG